MRRFIAIFHARNIEFVRDKTALAWTFLLPFFLVFGFAFIFDGGGTEVYKVGVYGTQPVQNDPFYKLKHIEFITITDLDNAIDKVRHHQLDMVVNTNKNNIYWINTKSTNGYLLERLMWSSRVNNQVQQELRQTVDGREIRYVDWVLPGILAMNMMFGCLFGVGFVLVRYRKNGVLKRLKATPLTAFEFLSAQVLSRLILVMIGTTSVFAACNWVFDIFVVGSYFAMFIIFALGTISLISLGLMMATRIKSEELANGILNLLSFPMMILSGVWFSLEGAHPYVVAFSKILPLTHMLDAIRAVMIDGATLVDVSNQIIILVALSVVFLIIGTVTFKWD